ncbi:hypothetical protein YC2023_038967 [Brassica napus]
MQRLDSEERKNRIIGCSPVMLQCGGKNVATTNTDIGGGFSFPSNTVSTIPLSEVVYDGCSQGLA